MLRISAINNCLSYNFGFGWFLLLLFSPFALTLGLRKLEAFFGFLITIMALTFGYEVGSQSHNRGLHQSHPTLPHAEPNGTGERTLAMPYPHPTSPPHSCTPPPQALSPTPASGSGLEGKNGDSGVEWGLRRLLPTAQEDPLEKGKATHSSLLAWRIPWTTVHGVTKNGT